MGGFVFLPVFPNPFGTMIGTNLLLLLGLGVVILLLLEIGEDGDSFFRTKMLRGY